jgi:hypothetical protein
MVEPLIIVEDFPEAKRMTGAARKDYTGDGVNANADNGQQDRHVFIDKLGVLLAVIRGESGQTVLELVNGEGETAYVTVNDDQNALIVSDTPPV